jgi:pimeloyl-ACP methyl ester carboxylesterase
MPLVFHNGTPTAALLFPPMVDAAARHGLQVVTTSRPGYADSSPSPGRTVADVAGDTAAVLDALGVDEFATIGWSGGGPHALACAALLPGRCRAALTLAGVAPYEGDGLDWLAGMSDENVEEFTCAVHGEESLTAFLDTQAPILARVEATDVTAALGGLVSAVDKAALTGEFAAYMAQTFSRAMSSGIAGWRDDDLAFIRPWGFDLASITRPVAVWQGGEDRMVPFAHGRWLADHVPGAVARLHPGEGHLSLAVKRMDDIVGDLAALAKSA